MQVDVQVVAMLRSRGAPVQPDTAVQLCKAAAINNVKFFELLLKYKIDVLAKVSVATIGLLSDARSRTVKYCVSSIALNTSAAGLECKDCTACFCHVWLTGSRVGDVQV